MKHFKKLAEPRYKGLNIYCTECARYVSTSKCSHFDRHIYKFRTKDKLGNTRIKNFESRELDKVLVSIVEYKKTINSDLQQQVQKSKPTNITLRDALVEYSKFLNNSGSYKFQYKKRSKDHIKDLIAVVADFLKVLHSKGIHPSRTLVTNVNLEMIVFYYDWLTDVKKYAPRTYNNKIIKIRGFFNYVINTLEIRMNNPFETVTKKEEIRKDNIIISMTEFNKVIEAVGAANKYLQLGGQNKEVKNMYRPYLVNIYKLALYTGMRREEWATVQWSDIRYSEDGSAIIVVDNLKVSRITQKTVAPTVIPVHPLLAELLKELGQDDLKDSNLYIIHPNRDLELKGIMDIASKSFSHFYKQAFNEGLKQMKCLRKTYMTELRKHTGDNMLEFGTHNKMQTLESHYLNKEVIAKTINNTNFFK